MAAIDLAVVAATGSLLHQSALTYNRPRALLPALGKPIIARAMEQLYRASGIRRFVVVVGTDEGSILPYLQSHWLADVHVDFVTQSPAENLPMILSRLALRLRSPFLFTSYNSFTHPNFSQRLLEHYDQFGDYLILSGSQTTLTRDGGHHFAVVEGSRVQAVVDIPGEPRTNMILTDMMVCGTPFVEHLGTLSAPMTETDFFAPVQHYLAAGGIAHIAESAWTLQIESDLDLLTLHRHLFDEEQDAHILSEIPGTIGIIPPVRIDPGVSVGRGAKIGPYVYLETGCSIGQDAVIQNAVIMQKVTVPPGAVVSDAILATRTRIDL